jgi:hypothetical protein
MITDQFQLPYESDKVVRLLGFAMAYGWNGKQQILRGMPRKFVGLKQTVFT